MTDVNAKSALPEYVSKAAANRASSSHGGISDNASQQGKDQFSRVLEKESRDQSANRSENRSENRAGGYAKRDDHSRRSEQSERSERSQSEARANSAERRDDKQVDKADDAGVTKTAAENEDQAEATAVAKTDTGENQNAETDADEAAEAVAATEEAIESEADASARALKQLAMLLDLPVEDLQQVSEEADNALLEAILRRSEHLAAKVDGEGPGQGAMKPEVLAELQQKWADKLQDHLAKLQAGEAEVDTETKIPVQIDQLQQRLQQLLKADEKAGEQPLEAKGLVRAMAAQLISNQGQMQSDQEHSGEEVMEQALEDAMDLLEALPDDRFEQIIKNAQMDAMSQKNGMKLAHIEKQVASDMLESLGVRTQGESIERTMSPNQLAAALRPQTPQSAASMMLQPHLQDSEWGAVFNQRIAMMVRNDLGTAELRLNPPELGAVQVKLQVQQDQATVSFTAAHGNVREAIEAALPRLREMLAESGVNLSSVDVNAGFKQQQEQAEQQLAGESGQGGSANGAGEDAEGDAMNSDMGTVRVAEGLVDAYA